MSFIRIAVIVVSCGVAAVARAEKPKLVLIPLTVGEGASEAATLNFQALLTQELKSRGDLELVTPINTRPAADKASGKGKASTEAASALLSARKAFDESRFDEASVLFKKAVDAFLLDPATADFGAIQEALVKGAAAGFRTDAEKEAKNALFELARLFPGYPLPNGYPPVFQREYERAQKRLEKQARGQLIIEAPAGSTVFLDGRDLGAAPATDEQVSAGVHYVRVDGARGERFAQAVEVKGSSVRVKALFGAPPQRGPVSTVPHPNVTATVDDQMAQRLAGYAKAAQADFVLIGLVYRVNDAQLSTGMTLFHARRSAFGALSPVLFDVDVLTANTEAFKLAEEISKRVASLGTPLVAPFPLVTKKAQTVTKSSVQMSDPSSDDLAVVGPERRAKPALEPRPEAALAPQPLGQSDGTPNGTHTEPSAEAKRGLPVWVWVAVGVVVAGGAAAGTYFGLREANRPVTGTVNASW